jgi:TolB protein
MNVVLAICALLTNSTSAAGSPVPEARTLPRLTGPSTDGKLFRLALPNALGEPQLAVQASEIARRAFDIVGFLKTTGQAAVPAELRREGLEASAAAWSRSGTDGVVKLLASREGAAVIVEGRLYQVARGDSPVLARTYRGPELRPLVHAFVNDVVAQLTGVRGIFGSRIAYAIPGPRSEIGSVGADGAEPKVLTAMSARRKAECLLPAYSPSGAEIAFTSYLRGTPDLWLVPAVGGRARILSKRPGMNSGAAWSPRVREIVMTLSHEGSADLYRISSEDGRVLERLTRTPSMDISATLSSDGSQIAFVSDREGTPQIFLMSSAGGPARRLTFQGKNNTTPRWNPRPEKAQIAFTGLDERGAFDVFIYDLKTGAIIRVTQHQGSNQSPDWSPDGRLLVYSSSRGGLFVMNPETLKEARIYKGRAASPSWGPAPRP